MKKLQLLLLSLLVFSTGYYAQINHPEQSNWIYGCGAGIDFSSGSPVEAAGSAMCVVQGSASLSDQEGNLLFYTDGVTVWNKNHQPMPNGSDLKGGPGTQPAIIVPKPCSNSYYIFTTTNVYGDQHLRFSEVDMTLDGGLGDVTSLKDFSLADSIAPKLTAYRSEGETDIWVITRQILSNRFLVWRVTSGGVLPYPVVSDAGNVIDNLGAGCLRISRQGNRLVSMNSEVDMDFTCDLLSFNPYNGKILPICSIPLPFIYPYGAEFSGNGSRLYISSWQPYPIWQYDLTQTDTSAIVDSGVAIAPHPGEQQYGALQMAPDGKIYVPYMEESYLACITNPDELGTDCGFVGNAIQLQNGISYIGLPNFMQGNMFQSCPGEIPNVITPNGDGINDVFYIDNVAGGEGALTVFNRWGTTVYDSDSYNNDWNGKGLSDGVYFYLYRYKNGENFSGHVQIIR